MAQNETDVQFNRLYPIIETTETEELESAWKDVFLRVYGDMLAPKVRELFHYGMPHMADGMLLTRFVLADGLSPMRSNLDNYRLRYLLKAWRVGNPKRGLHFLHTYLQMMYPNSYSTNMLWQDRTKPYPTALLPEKSINNGLSSYFLTSRLSVDIRDLSAEDAQDLEKYIPIIRNMLPARLLLQLSVSRSVSAEPNKLVLGSGFTAYAAVSINAVAVMPTRSWE